MYLGISIISWFGASVSLVTLGRLKLLGIQPYLERVFKMCVIYTFILDITFFYTFCREKCMTRLITTGVFGLLPILFLFLFFGLLPLW